MELTTAEKIRRLPWHTTLLATNNIFAQLTFFGSVFVLFLDALGSNNSQIGFLLSMLPFFGIVAVFIAPRVAQIGYKRIYLTFFGVRKFIVACLVFVPLVLREFGMEWAMVLITAVVIGFSFCRAVAETAYYPWSQEFIPNSMRGKHSAINDMVSRITGMAAIAAGGYVLGLSTGLERFSLLFGVACAFGLLAVWSATHLPGGAPIRAQQTSYRNMLNVLRDRNFNLYMLGLGLVTFGGAPLAFLPLFMQDHVGLSESAVVWLQIGTILGGFSAVYLIGWAADRYGSKPLLMSGLLIKTLLPLGWLLMPRNSEVSLAVALLIAAVWGIAEIAWAIGSGRLLFVKVVPVEKKTEYMAVFYAAIGLIGGLSQIISGGLLDLTNNISGEFIGMSLDPFTPLFIASIILTGFGTVLFNRVKADSGVSLGEFAGLFMHGNPVLALESLMRYYRAKDERAAVTSTERMGLTRSPLTVDELLEALKDPRFNVRFEAIISIARMGSEPRLVNALCRILDGTELSLSVIAAWALGRMGNDDALPTLRRGLESPYRSIQAHCARALGTLDDQSMIPLLLERLPVETDKGLRIAYASALGSLRAQTALPALFDVLDQTENEGARMELALSIARVLGDESHFIRLLRQVRQDCGTAAAQETLLWKRKLEKSASTELRAKIDHASNEFAWGRLDVGAKQLAEILNEIPHEADQPCTRIIQHGAAKLHELGAKRLEYLVLIFHAMYEEGD